MNPPPKWLTGLMFTAAAILTAALHFHSILLFGLGFGLIAVTIAFIARTLLQGLPQAERRINPYWPGIVLGSLGIVVAIALMLDAGDVITVPSQLMGIVFIGAGLVALRLRNFFVAVEQQSRAGGGWAHRWRPTPRPITYVIVGLVLILVGIRSITGL